MSIIKKLFQAICWILQIHPAQAHAPKVKESIRANINHITAHYWLYRNCGGREYCYYFDTKEEAFGCFEEFKPVSHLLELREVQDSGTTFQKVYVAESVDVNSIEYLFPKPSNLRKS
jgi:hypothetical protein